MSKNSLAKRFAATTGWVSLAAVSVGIVIGVGAASAAGASARNDAMPYASGPMKSVVVLLRDTAAGTGPRSAARMNALRTGETPLAKELLSAGATHVSTGTTLPIIDASVSPAQQAALAANPAVKAVFPNQKIQAPVPVLPEQAALSAPSTVTPATPVPDVETPGPCGTSGSPEQDPEALGVINAPQAWSDGYTGAGITVAYIAGGIDTTIADFQRNIAYGSAGPVVTNVNFSGDPSADTGGDASIESFLDASSIAAQGNTKFDLSNFVNISHPLGSGCDITVTGAAPGASVLGLDVFSNDYATTTSNFLQAIDYAVGHSVKVLNESFGGNPFPDSALDAIKIADDDAVSAGVTVVVSSGDAGVTSTIGSPATDPNLISAGASTTFRAYHQYTYGGINASSPNSNNNTWIDNNISSLSSGGFSQSGGNTVDLVAPGDLNWTLCSTNTSMYPCYDENGNPSGIIASGGTSESSPLTAAAAADVIQAYWSTHSHTYPTPALVKQILMSTATDIDAPAEQQGAGLLNILAAVKEATSIGRTSATPGSLEISPNQINITQNPGATTTQQIGVTNTGTSAVTVHLSTRTLTTKIASTNGSFCMNPTTRRPIGCGPETTNTFQTGRTASFRSYQEETFSVPNTHGTDVAAQRLGELRRSRPDSPSSSVIKWRSTHPTAPTPATRSRKASRTTQHPGGESGSRYVDGGLLHRGSATTARTAGRSSGQPTPGPTTRPDRSRRPLCTSPPEPRATPPSRRRARPLRATRRSRSS